MSPTAFDHADTALAALRRDRPDVLITDIRMPGRSGLELLTEIRDSQPELPVIVMTAHSDLDSAVAAYQGGAFEYLPKPFDIDQAVDLVRRAAQQRTRVEETHRPKRGAFLKCSARRRRCRKCFAPSGGLSRSSMTVLITGESGTGKELVARALHRHSPRANKAFIALNTSAFTADLLESELFGHEKGSFTGADAQRRGRFEQADGGTLFLDEIGDMSPQLQTRLLRVLAEGEFYRVGGQVPVRVDVRAPSPRRAPKPRSRPIIVRLCRPVRSSSTEAYWPVTPMSWRTRWPSCRTSYPRPWPCPRPAAAASRGCAGRWSCRPRWVRGRRAPIRRGPAGRRRPGR